MHSVDIGNFKYSVNDYGRMLSEDDENEIKRCLQSVHKEIDISSNMEDEELIHRTNGVFFNFLKIIIRAKLHELSTLKIVLDIFCGDVELYAWDESKPLHDSWGLKFGFRFPTFNFDARQVNLIVDTINNNLFQHMKPSLYINNAPKLLEDEEKKVGMNEFVFDINKPYETFVLDSGDEKLYEKVVTFTSNWLDSVEKRPDFHNLRWKHIRSTVRKKDEKISKKISISYEGYNSFPPDMLLTFDASALTAEEYTRLGRELFQSLGGYRMGEYLTHFETGFDLLTDDKQNVMK